MKAYTYLLKHLMYLFFGVLFFSTAGCYDIFMTPDEDLSPRAAAPKIAVLAAPCFREGEALTVYNPYDADLNYYASKAYRVEWLEKGILQFEGANTPCICGKTLRVVVTRLEDNATVSMSYRVRECADIPEVK